MSPKPQVPLSSLHRELSHLAFAVKEAFDDILCEVKVVWDANLYLQVHIETRAKNTRLVADRLAHGILWGPYNYRFKSSSYQTHVPEDTWIVIVGYPDMYFKEATDA